MKKIYLFAVIFALITGFATYFFINSLQHNSVITGVEEADVVVAMQDIEKDTVLKPDMFTVIRVPVTSITYGSLVRASDVNGYVAAEKLYKGEQVLAAKLLLFGEEGNGLEYNGEYRLSYHLDNEHYAYTISVDAEDSVAHFIRRGDYINLYYNEASADIPLLENIRVLEIGSYSDRKNSLAGAETLEYTMLTLELTEEQIEDLLPYGNVRSGDSLFSVALVPYAVGAEITTEPEKKHKKGEEPETTERAEELLTNYGMGEIYTEPPTTAVNG